MVFYENHQQIEQRKKLGNSFTQQPLYIVSCQSVVQLGGPDPGFAQEGPAKVRDCMSVLFTESSFVVEMKNTWLVLSSQSNFNHFASMLYTMTKCHSQL